MLQSLRENLKGSVAVVVVAIFVVPLVLFGVEQMFVGSVGGSDAAEVNGEEISNIALQREILLEKQRLAQRFNLEPTAPELEDDVLREPVLRRMVQRLALVQAAKQAGMGASRDELWRQISQVDAFRVDGKFNYEIFKERISGLYTPATYLDAVSKDFIIGHLNAGIAGSSFVTATELAVIAAITEQQRDIFSLSIPALDLASVSVGEDEIESYYQANQQQFSMPETVTVEYVDLSLDLLAEGTQPSEAEIRAVYEDEMRSFEANPKYVVAHVLVENKDDSKGKIAEVQQQLQNGAAFEEVVAKYSDDLGSKSTGGVLGEVVEDAYPEKFVAAVKNLKVGEVSSPVTTEAGTHFIKLLEKKDANPPSLAERRDAIARQLSQAMAQEKFTSRVAELDELTFGNADLKKVAERLNLQVKESAPFSRSGGSGIASFDKVVDAAFGKEVLEQGYNSRVLELSDQRAVVVRIKDRKPKALQPLVSVRDQIKSELQKKKAQETVAQKARELMAQLEAGRDPQELAGESGANFQVFEAAERSNTEIEPAIIEQAFSLARPGDTGGAVLNVVALPSGGQAVVGVTAVRDGSVKDLSEQQLSAIRSQVGRQMGQVEMIAFEDSIVKSADVETR